MNMSTLKKTCIARILNMCTDLTDWFCEVKLSKNPCRLVVIWIVCTLVRGCYTIMYKYLLINYLLNKGRGKTQSCPQNPKDRTNRCELRAGRQVVLEPVFRFAYSAPGLRASPPLLRKRNQGSCSGASFGLHPQTEIAIPV